MKKKKLWLLAAPLILMATGCNNQNSSSSAGSSSAATSQQASSTESKSSEVKPSSTEDPTIAVTSVTITNGATAEVNEGTTLQLNATVLPGNATDKAVTWSAPESGAGMVSSTGLFTAGQVDKDTPVVVTATAGGKTDTITITVKNDLKGFELLMENAEKVPAIDVTDTANVAITNTAYQANFLGESPETAIASATSYSMSAHIVTDAAAPVAVTASGSERILHAGFMPYYVDADNYLTAYVEWWSSDQDGWCREFNLKGKLNGTEINNDCWLEGIQVNPANGIDLKVIRDGNVFKFEMGYGESSKATKTVSVSGIKDTATTKLGFYAVDYDGGKVTFTNAATSIYVAPKGYTISDGSSTIVENENGSLTYTPAVSNWKTGFAIASFDNLANKTKYTISAHMVSTGAAPFTSDAQIGFIPFYEDTNNFLMAYAEYTKDRPNGRCLQMTGNINGTDVGWAPSDKWIDGTPTNPAEGFDFVVARDGGNFTITMTQGTTVIDVTWDLSSKFDSTKATSKVGFYGNGAIGAITISDISITTD